MYAISVNISHVCMAATLANVLLALDYTHDLFSDVNGSLIVDRI